MGPQTLWSMEDRDGDTVELIYQNGGHDEHYTGFVLNIRTHLEDEDDAVVKASSVWITREDLEAMLAAFSTVVPATLSEVEEFLNGP
jgi:uncharacterized protein YfcZ (UPF0381/DUF406 family)